MNVAPCPKRPRRGRAWLLGLVVAPALAAVWHAPANRPLAPLAVRTGAPQPPAGVWVPPADMFTREALPVFCFAPGTDPAVVAYYSELIQYDPIYRYQLASRWPGSQGEPTVLRWSFVPDGLLIDGSVPSDLFATMDAKFGGNRALWISKFQACFERWHALTGITYEYITYGGEDWDDGASWGSSGSSTRGDIRIAGKNIDGASSVLAYNYYPGSGNGGDMVMDTSENWGSAFNDYRFLRNVVLHEHGHGIGLAHVCPANGSKLMEPYLNTSFDGPQHDDERAGQRHYGDPYETDNTYTAAFDLGTLTFGVPVTLGPVPAPPVNAGSVLSIDANGEIDWFKFTTTEDAVALVTVTPQGGTYDSSPQNGDGSCGSGNVINSLAAADLAVQLVAADGSTVLATAASQAAGSAEQIYWYHLPNGPATYYVKVYETSTPTEAQLYHLSVQVNAYDPVPPTPNPMTFATPPYGTGYSSVTMEATTASDADSLPVYYLFEFVSGGNGGTSSAWITSTTYSDTGLSINTAYTYRVTARDSATPWNETAPSVPATAVTFIETPVGTNVGAVTPNSIEILVNGTLTNLDLGSSGVYFDCIGGGCDTGLNQWVKATSATATGLSANTVYGFRVKARNQDAVETEWSLVNAYVYTLANVPGSPVLSQITSTSLQLDVEPNGNPGETDFAVYCTSTTDPAWQGKYVGATGQPVNEPAWQSDMLWGNLTISGLLPGTQYCFAVKARNGDEVETALSTPACAQTASGGGLVGDLNCDGTVDFGDINAFVSYISNFAGWQATYPGCPAANGDINGDGQYPSFGDINPFVALLTGG